MGGWMFDLGVVAGGIVWPVILASSSTSGDATAALYGLSGVPLVVALVQVVKIGWPAMGKRWYPLVTLLIAVGWNLTLGYLDGVNLGLAAVLGVVTGLAASGLYTHALTVFGSATSASSSSSPPSPASPASGPPMVPPSKLVG